MGDTDDNNIQRIRSDHSDNSMQFQVNNSERMRIDSSGNVGIGITSMVNPLHVGVTSNTASKTSGSAFDGGALRLDGSFGTTNSEVAILGGANDGLSSGIGFARQSSGNWGTQLRFYTHGSAITTTDELTERMRITADGNVGIGTTSPSADLEIASTTTIAGARLTTSAGSDSEIEFINTSSGNHTWAIGQDFSNSNAFSIAYSNAVGASLSSNSKVVIDSSGNVGIGTTSPASLFHVKIATNENIRFSGGSGDTRIVALNDAGSASTQLSLQGDPLLFRTSGGAEMMRIDSSGNLLVGTTSGSNKLNVVGGGGAYVASFDQSATSSQIGISITYSASSPNNVANRFISASDATTGRFAVRSNGGIENYSANDVNLSDERVKKDIADSGSYLEKLCNIPVRNFRYNEDAEDSKHHLGVIAQEVEAVAPEFVNKASWEHKDGPMDTVYNTDLMFAMMKSIQELSAQVNELKAEVAALKGA
jgi:hypothetical protein